MQETSADEKTKIYVTGGIIFSVVFFLFIRLFWLQIIKGDIYLEQSMDNRTQYITVPAYRSVIYDTTGENQLAYNRRSLAIVLIPGNLPSDATEKTNALSNAAELLNLNLEDIEETIEEASDEKYTPIVLKYDISSAELVKFAENYELYPGMFWENRPRRIYPLREDASQVIGYTGIISPSELDELGSLEQYHSGSVLGKMGIEYVYDEEIRGLEGLTERIVDARGNVLEQTIIKDAVPGDPLILSLHSDMQELAYELLDGRTGSVVVSKPTTGELLVLCSSPGFDPNLFTEDFSEDEFYILKNNEDKPFLNRAIQGSYPPASVFKIVTSAAVLSEGVSADFGVTCNGWMWVGNRIYKCWDSHGEIENLYDALAHSCDIYYYTTGIQIGREPIVEMAREFGLDEKTGVDLMGETVGLVPSIEWFTNAHGRPWSTGDTANISIGQGDLLATPIGINAMTMGVVNDGVIYKPYLLKEIRSILDPETITWEKEPEILRQVNLETEYFEDIRTGMTAVCEEGGTAGWLRWLTTIPMAGKTGTGQAGGDLEDHAWFTCFAPADYTDIEDVICVTVCVEHGGGGSSAAGPIAAQLVELYFSEINPLEEVEEE